MPDEFGKVKIRWTVTHNMAQLCQSWRFHHVA